MTARRCDRPSRSATRPLNPRPFKPDELSGNASGFAPGRHIGRGWGGESGNALVEFAIVGTLFMLLVFGVIEFGMTLNSNISLSNSVREAARQAAVANYNGGDSSCAGTPAAELACFTKHNSGLTTSGVRVSVSFPTGANYVVGQEVSVCASYPMTSITGLLSQFLGGRFLHAESKMRLEQTPGSSPGSFQDPPPPGDSWSWCN